MSHLPLRKETNCLNCGATLTGRYCADCGQENTEPKESVWHLITHFFNDVTHFDGKFFSSMKYLLLRPGFLSEEYMKGRRASYLNPIRMYLFISALFFLLFMSFFKPVTKEETKEETKEKQQSQKPSLDTGASNLRKGFREIAVALDSADVRYQVDTEKITLINGFTLSRSALDTSGPSTVKGYDSLQRLLPPGERDGFIARYFSRKGIAVGEVSRKDKKGFGRHTMANFYHSLPYMVFISLPILALLMRLLYVRRKQYYYVSHAIFVIHYISTFFIGLLFSYTFKKFGDWGEWVAIFINIGMFVYLYAAMRRFYKQGWFKTFVKFFLFYFIGGLFVSILALLFLINSALNAV